MMSNKYPSTWVEASLPDVAYFQEGPGLRKTQFREEGIPFVNIQTLSNERVNKEKCKFLDPEEVKSKYEHFLLETDDIICSSSGTLGKTAIVREDDKPLMLNTSVIRFRPHVPSLFSRGYLHIFLKSQNFLRQALNASSGSAQVNFGPTHLVKFAIPVPPTNEQHRIVAKIEELFSELDEGIENLKTAQAQLKVYRQALLKHAFEGKLTAQWHAKRHANQSVAPAKAGAQLLNDMDSRLRGNDEVGGGNDEVGGGNDKRLETAEALLKRIQQERAQRYQQQLADWESSGKQGSKPKASKPLPPLTAEELAELPELPEGWGWVRPEEICIQEPYSIGIGPFGSNLKVSDYRESGIPLIFVKNITRSNFIKDLKYIDEAKYRELLPHSVKALDLLITKMGDPPGDCEIYPEGSPNAVLTADCLKFRLWDEFASRKLYKYCINSNFVKRQLGLITKGVAQKKISVERFKTICLPFFCVEEQNVLVQELESKLSEVDQLDQTITTALQQAEALRQSILKKAFSGQLVPQDPNDEPASELLARIRVEIAASSKVKGKQRSARKEAS